MCSMGPGQRHWMDPRWLGLYGHANAKPTYLCGSACFGCRWLGWGGGGGKGDLKGGFGKGGGAVGQQMIMLWTHTNTPNNSLISRS